MSLVIETPLPKTGYVEGNYAFEIVVSAKEAKRITDTWIHEEVATLLMAEEPTLIVTNDATVWRVPIMYVSSRVGKVETVGEVDVDVRTGEIYGKDPERMIERASVAAETLPPYKPRTHVPEQFIPKHLPRAEMLILPGDDA